MQRAASVARQALAAGIKSKVCLEAGWREGHQVKRGVCGGGAAEGTEGNQGMEVVCVCGGGASKEGLRRMEVGGTATHHFVSHAESGSLCD